MDFKILAKIICILGLIIIHTAQIRAEQVAPKIIGGETVQDGEAKFMAALQTRVEDKFVHRCGAALIAKDKIITLTWCLFNNEGTAWEPTDLRVIMGSGNLLSSNAVPFNVVKHVYHKEYDYGDYRNNVALIFIKKINAKKFPNIAPIKLTDSEVKAGESCAIYGWGITDLVNRSYSEILYRSNLKVLETEKCKEKYKDQFYGATLCAGNEEGGSGPCTGDFGGPLVCGDKLCAILAMKWRGSDCAAPNSFYRYDSVYYFKDWIEKGYKTLGVHSNSENVKINNILFIFVIIFCKFI